MRIFYDSNNASALTRWWGEVGETARTHAATSIVTHPWVCVSGGWDAGWTVKFYANEDDASSDTSGIDERVVSLSAATPPP